MKRNLIYSVFAALLLASCSSNEDIPTPAPAPETLDAYLSLSVSNGAVLTKAATRAEDGDEEIPTASNPGDGTDEGYVDPAGTTDIKSFTVAIFRGAPTSGTETLLSTPAEIEGSLAYFNTFPISIADDKKENNLCVSNIVSSKTEIDEKTGATIIKDYQINGIKVKAGNLKVLIMANIPEKELSKFAGCKTQNDFEKVVYGDLSAEGFNNAGPSYPCSMKSDWISVNIAAKENNEVYYLFSDEAVQAVETTSDKTATTTDADRTFLPSSSTGSSIRLYRNVSAVAFKNITLDPSDGWGKTNGAKLTLKAIFITNALNRTSMTIGTPITESIKEGAKSTIYYGGYKTYHGNGKGAVLATVRNNEGLPCLYKDLEKKGYLIDTKNGDNYLPVKAGETCVGKYFMVYENSYKMNQDEGKHTLITLYADYSYTDNRGDAHTVKDCFYTVVVNDENNKGGAGYGNYVERNYIYNVNLTIVGPGSTNPYIPLYTANATAFVEAAAWTGAVNIDQDVE